MDKEKSLKKNLLFHVCCGVCAAWPLSFLRENYRVTAFFCNPNIYPAEEYARRLAAARTVSHALGINLILADDRHEYWRQSVRGREQDPERGERCALCFRYRLGKTARLAKEKNFQIFGTTLTIGPQKDSQAILAIGREIGASSNLEFLALDLKKQGGSQKTNQLAKEYNLYRQNYCGCEFSQSRVRCS